MMPHVFRPALLVFSFFCCAVLDLLGVVDGSSLVPTSEHRLDFSNSEERRFVDLPLSSGLPSGATSVSLSLSFSASRADLVRGFSFHFRSGAGWYSYSLAPVSPGELRLSIPLDKFTKEDAPDSLHKASSFRVSAWRNTAVPKGTASIVVRSLSSRKDTVAILRATSYIAPGESWAGAPADRCAKILDRAGVAYTVIPDTTEDLSPYELVFLPYAPKPPDAFVKRLISWVSPSWLSQGKPGKLVVFYSASQALARALGFSVSPWQGAKDGHGWSAIRSADARIPYLTTNILPPAPKDSSARTVATWVDEADRDSGIPAVCLSSRGAWFAHIPPLPTHSAASFFRGLIRILVPTTALSPLPSPGPVAVKLADGPASEFRGVWEPRGNARGSLQWQSFFRQLSEQSIHAAFIHWQSAGTAHYRTTAPDTRPFSQRVSAQFSNPVADALRAAAAVDEGVAIHAWATCFTLEGADPGQIHALSSAHRLLNNASGGPWLDPALPANGSLVIEGLVDLARRGVAGVHLDYVRYPEPVTDETLQRARMDAITGFLRQARNAIRLVSKKTAFSVAVYASPENARAMGQDWPAWVREGLVDFVVPMAYTESPETFRAMLRQALAAGVPPAAIVAGIGTGADESQLDAAGASAQIAVCRQLGLLGFSFFASDCELLSVTLPALNGR